MTLLYLGRAATYTYHFISRKNTIQSSRGTINLLGMQLFLFGVQFIFLDLYFILSESNAVFLDLYLFLSVSYSYALGKIKSNAERSRIVELDQQFNDHVTIGIRHQAKASTKGGHRNKAQIRDQYKPCLVCEREQTNFYSIYNLLDLPS